MDINFPSAFYPAPQEENKVLFDVPNHTVNTANLLVFINGVLAQREVHYHDISATQIKFTREIRVNDDIYVLLLVEQGPGGGTPGGGGGGTPGPGGGGPGGGGGGPVDPQIVPGKVEWENETPAQQIHFYKVAKAAVPTNTTYNGQLWLTTDTHELFMAQKNGTVVQIGGQTAAPTPATPKVRDYYFMLGDILNLGAQTQSEMLIPHKGKIKEVVVAVGEDSEATSNLVFSIQYHNTTWQTLQQFEMEAGKLKDSFTTNLAVDKPKLRVNLVGGNLQKFKNAMIMLKFEMEA